MLLWPCFGIVAGGAGAVFGLQGNLPLTGLVGMVMGLLGVIMPITILVDLFGACEGCDENQMIAFGIFAGVGFLICVLESNKQ
jgi:hypothetical protein